MDKIRNITLRLNLKLSDLNLIISSNVEVLFQNNFFLARLQLNVLLTFRCYLYIPRNSLFQAGGLFEIKCNAP